MAAYLLFMIEVADPEAYRAYVAEASRVTAAHGGRYLVRGGNPEALEGALVASRHVLIEFPDRAAARRFYASPDYQAILPLRQAHSTGRAVLLDGA